MVPAGTSRPLTLAIAKDPAMMIWLDTITDDAAHPNENFARECMELFTLGIGNYTENDVRDAARAFTGWKFNPITGAFMGLAPRQHDDGTKTVLGQTGDWGGEDVVRILAAQTRRPGSSPRGCGATSPTRSRRQRPGRGRPGAGFARDHDITGLLRAMLLHPMFTSSTARTGLVKQADRVGGRHRPCPRAARPATPTDIGALAALGQEPLRPAQRRGLAAERVLAHDRVDADPTAAGDARRADVADVRPRAGHRRRRGPTAPRPRPGALVASWGAPTAAALAGAAATPRRLLALALVSPEYTLA